MSFKRVLFGIAVQVCFAAMALAQPVTSHPRIWFTQADLPRLRSWAVSTNPIYQNGLRQLAQNGVALMNNGTIPNSDPGDAAYAEYPTEAWAALFAYMSQIENDPAVRDDYGNRARTLLMYVINQAAQGPADDLPFRDPSFSVFDRSRWYGAGFPLTVDWIYGRLNAQDKAAIRTVFLRWCQENAVAYPYPQFNNSINDPQNLRLDDPKRRQFRYAGNNYYGNHARNMALMALSLDAADDPGNQVRGYLDRSVGQWLYATDQLFRTDALGGMSPEGFEYMISSMGAAMQLILALRTSGEANPVTRGQQVVINGHPFWEAVIPAYFQLLAPRTFNNPDYGVVHLPRWYGDGEHIYAADFIPLFGAMGVHDLITGNTQRLQQIRWLETNIPPDGASDLAHRARSDQEIYGSIFYFMIFDPAAPAAADPRPSLPTSHFSPGLGWYLARTDWTQNASMFAWRLGWNRIDHMHGDGNYIELYRNGEWLTKERTGYGLIPGASDYKNTLALENDPASLSELHDLFHARGSQYILAGNHGDPVIVARSEGNGWFHATGDSTNLYNFSSCDDHAPFTCWVNVNGIAHASRSLFWLKPDRVIVYDRARSVSANRFKRFWLNLPGVPAINGNLTTTTTPGGQRFFIRTLLPSGASIQSVTQDPTACEPGLFASFDPLNYNNAACTPARPGAVRLRVEAPGAPQSTRFLHVLQGADANGTADVASLINSVSGPAYQGVAVNGTAMLFPVDLTPAPTGTLVYDVPAGINRQLVTGLAPNATASRAFAPQSGGTRVTITFGGAGIVADAGGVLDFTIDGPPPLPVVSIDCAPGTIAEAGGVSQCTVTRSGATTGALAVQYTTGGTATSAADYTALSGNVTIATGAASAAFAVTALDDAAVESNETVILTIAANAAYTVGAPAAATVTITSEDAAGRRKGDVNGNGSVSAFDAAMVLQSVVGTRQLDDTQRCAADYNSNQSVSAFDAALILQCVVSGNCSSVTCN